MNQNDAPGSGHVSEDQPWVEYEEFASMAGFGPGLAQLEQKNELKWTNTATDLHTGGIHGLRYKVERPEPQKNPQKISIMLQHWVQWPGGKIPAEEQKKHNPHILTFETETRLGPDGQLQIRPVSAVWMGKTYTDAVSLNQLLQLLQETSEKIRDNIRHNVAQPGDPSAFPHLQRRVRQTHQRDEIPNLYHIAQRCNFKTPFALEGMYFNGDFNFGKPVQSETPPVYPLQLLRPMLAIEDDIALKGARPFSRTYSLPGEKPGTFAGATYRFDPRADGFSVACVVWNTESQPKEETELYRISFTEDGISPEGAKLYRLDNLEMLGAKPDIRDHKGAARAMRAMKYIHMAIQRGEPPLFSGIINEHDLKAFLRQPPAPENGPDHPRTLLQVFGANTDAVFSRKELSIGSNGLAIIRDFKKDNGKGGEWVKLGMGVDWGVTFGNPKTEYYHSITHNYGRFMRHPAAPHIQPYFDNILNLETHEHEDHLRGIVRFAKFGYELPPMVMNMHTKRVLKRMMGEEGIPRPEIEAIIKRCHIIDIRDFTNLKAEDKGRVQTFEYGDTVIEQGVETIWSEEENREKYFPRLTAWSKKYPEAKTNVRVGPAGHSAHALMFEVEGVLYTGDYKLDQTIPADIRTDFDWLRKCRENAVVHVQETTNAAKDVPFNPTIAEVRKNREEILYTERKNRVFYDTIGSNAIDIEAFCAAAGNVRKRVEEENKTAGNKAELAPFKYIIFAGSAIRNKYSDLNATHDIKGKMKREYGIQTLHVDSKKAQALLSGQEKGSFVTIMTGTQDEPLSLTHRVSRDLHDTIRLGPGDAVIRGQAPIPGENRYALRLEQNNRYRHNLGCTVYDAVEMARAGIYIYTSSHASQDDYRKVHELTGDLLKMLHHGGPEQLNKMKMRMDEIGARAMIPDKQALYYVEKGQPVAVVGETPEERVGFREIRDDEREFFKKHRQQPTRVRVTDRWIGPVATQMYRFERAAEAREEMRTNAGPTNRGANVVEAFNEAATGTADFPPIGILHPSLQRPYYEQHKAIKLFIGMDTETTGANTLIDVHTDSSFAAFTPDGKPVAEKTLKHAIPPYMMISAGALGVTHNDNPKKLYRGLPLRRYVHELHNVYRKWTGELTEDNNARALFHGYRDSVFDNAITMRMMGMALAGQDMKPMATHGNLSLDVYNLYTAMIALMPDKVNAKRDGDGNYLRTLRSACLENGVEYNDEEAHGSLYDAQRTSKLLFKFKEIAPDIFEQMVLNCDFSASRSSPMIDHILGRGQHLNDQAPVFGYVDMRDRSCTPRLGGLVAIDKKATDAIVIDLAQADIQQLEQLPDQKLLELMNDPNGPFAVIKLNKSPCLFPPQMVWRDQKVRAKAIGRLPKSTIMQRANALRQANTENHEIGNSFAQRIHKLYGESRLCRNPAYYGNNGASHPSNDNNRGGEFKPPNQRVFSLFKIIKAVNQISNRHYKTAAQILRALQPSEEEFAKKARTTALWRTAVRDIRRLSKESGGRDQAIEDLRFLIEWQADDICPQVLPAADRLRMNALKSTMLHGPDNAQTMTIARFRKDIESMESDPVQFARIIGEGPEAQERWKHLKAVYLAYADTVERRRKFTMTAEKRDHLRAHRRNNGPKSDMN